MRFSVRVNNDLPFAELLALAGAAEQAGFDQLWFSNDLFLRSAPVLAGALAALTERISLGIAVMNPYSVHVSELAMVAATAQEVSGGRFLLGLGAGAEQFLGWAGLARPRPLAVTRTALVVLRTLLGHADADRAMLPEWFGPDSVLRFPLDRPVPVYVGAMGPKMLEMAGRHADGVLAGSGLRPQDFAPAARLAHDGPHNRHRAAALIDDRMLSLGVAGDVADVLARCRALARLGARHLSFGPPLGPDPVAAVRLLGEQVLPAVAEVAGTALK